MFPCQTLISLYYDRTFNLSHVANGALIPLSANNMKDTLNCCIQRTGIMHYGFRLILWGGYLLWNLFSEILLKAANLNHVASAVGEAERLIC